MANESLAGEDPAKQEPTDTEPKETEAERTARLNDLSAPAEAWEFLI